jgi:hypothetical protein
MCLYYRPMLSAARILHRCDEPARHSEADAAGGA